MAIFRGKIGEGVGRYWPQRSRSYFWGFTPLCQIWWKSTKKCDRESDDTRTDRQTHTHRLTDANRFYYLSHAICYSYGADKRYSTFMTARCLLKVIRTDRWYLRPHTVTHHDSTLLAGYVRKTHQLSSNGWRGSWLVSSFVVISQSMVIKFMWWGCCADTVTLLCSKQWKLQWLWYFCW